VNEHILAAVIANDEAKTLLRVEEFDDALAFADDLGRHSPARAATGTAAAETTAATASAAAAESTAATATVTAATAAIAAAVAAATAAITAAVAAGGRTAAEAAIGETPSVS
jgi:hypothetical protein